MFLAVFSQMPSVGDGRRSHLVDHESSSGCSTAQAAARRCAGNAPWSQPWSHRGPQRQLIRPASLHDAATCNKHFARATREAANLPYKLVYDATEGCV